MVFLHEIAVISAIGCNGGFSSNGPTFLFYNAYKHKHRTPPHERALDFSRSCSPPAPLVVQYALIVHGVLVSDDETVLK
jgi:hypothetical protein